MLKTPSNSEAERLRSRLSCLVLFVFALLVSHTSLSPVVASTAWNNQSSQTYVASDNATAPVKRVGTYWLNFTVTGSNGGTLAVFPFQFYVAVNSTNEWDGLAELPQIVTKASSPNPFYFYPSVNYSEFRNITGVFQSYVDQNGSRPDTAILYPGPPYYGPSDRHYYFILGCGFPCIRNGVFVEANSSGVSSYSGWSYLYGASDLVLHFFGGSE